MNKKFTRLTALLLAMLMTISMFSTAFAGTTLSRDEYDQALQQMQDDLNLIPTEVPEGIDTQVTVTGTTLVPVAVPVEGGISAGGSIELTAESAADYYQWQILVDDIWANIVNENGASLTLTYSMALNALTEDNNISVRRLHFDAEGNLLENCDEFTVPVSTEVNTEEREINFELDVTQYTRDEEPGDNYYAAWDFQNIANGNGRRAYALTPAAEDDERSTYNLIITYKLHGENVASPYPATLAKGSSFTVTVKHPTVQGYAPSQGTVDGWNVDGIEYTDTETKINLTNIQQDVNLLVNYVPAEVEYTVIHYKQNVENDEYAPVLTETKHGYTESIVPEVAKVYKNEAGNMIHEEGFEGFYALMYEKPQIAADGKTVVEVYYDRNYYLINFNLGEGGYGVEPIYARFGTSVDSVGTPTRPGYTFLGWSLNGTDKVDLPKTMPSKNTTYIAMWKMKETAKVSVVLWGENPNDEEYSYLGTGELELTSNSSYTYNGTDQLYLYCELEEHNHNTDVCGLNCGKAEHITHTDECLECSHLTHTLDCYQTTNWYTLKKASPEQTINATYDGVYTYTTGYVYRTTHYYLYLDGEWYCAFQNWGNNNSKADTESIELDCDHTHTDACLGCETHSHIDACYNCGKTEHAHDSNCTGTVEGLDSKLWKFVKSDTVTVNPDGSTVINVYYDRTTFTMTFKKEGYNGETLGTIEEKWGANIMQRFKTISEANTFFWSMKSNGGSPWTSFMDVMPPENRTYYADPQSGSTTLTATYYGENVAGTEYDTLYTVSFKGSSGLTVSKEEFVVIEGFTFNSSKSTKTGSYYNGSKFYYDRNYYSIEFYNPTALIKKAERINYGAELDDAYFVPGDEWIPEQYEPGSVKFAGWYLNPECTGEEFDFTTHTMPAVPSGSSDASYNNSGETALTVYAKWVPVTLKVEFYLDEAACDDGVKLITHQDIELPHGSKVEPVPADPTNGEYTFVGWFYKEDGVEKAFDFANMPVTKNLKVYGKWSSNVLMEYSVYFKIQGTDTEIADPIIGSTLAGQTKTFDAKGGTELYSGYQAGYFPLVESHSITLNIEDESKNTFTFWYVSKESVPYTVYYVAETLKENGTSLGTIERDGKTYYIIAETKYVKDNKQAVVTEQFVVVDGYMPDAYQKRLIIDGSDDAVNEIIFFYSVDTEHAYYKITHYIKELDGSWTEYASSQAIGDIGKEYTADPMTIIGFGYSETEYAVNGNVTTENKLTNDGLEINLYYTRNSYPYVVYYMEQNTGKQLAVPVTSRALYEKLVEEHAISIDNYTAVEPTIQTINIRIDDGKDAPKLNVITFYYVENYVPITYKVVGPDGSGTVDIIDGMTLKLTEASENVNVLTGTALGAKAEANIPTYKFVGWFTDEKCENPVDASWVMNSTASGAELKPQKVDDVNVEAIYYAKFDWNVSTLTISKSGMAAGESAIFTVKATTADANGGNSEKEFTVVVPNGSSVTISDVVINTSYIVTEQNDWTWRYTTTSPVEGTIASTGSTASFDNVISDYKWLSDESIEVNTFKDLK